MSLDTTLALIQAAAAEAEEESEVSHSLRKWFQINREQIIDRIFVK